MNTQYFGERAKKAKSSERAEAMPAAIITAIISSLLLLGIATVVSLVVQEKGESQSSVALATVVSNIDVSLRSDVSQASYITASAKLKQPTARLLTPTDVLLSGVNMHIPATNGECKVVRWSINGTTASRDLTVYKTQTKVESFVKCDETSPVLAKRTKVFAQDVNVKAPFKFNNQVGRPIAFTLDNASLTKANTELEKQLNLKGVQKLSDTDFNELNKLMGTDSYAPGFADACVMNATKVNGVCPEAEADTVAAAWGSLKIAKVSVAFEIATNTGEIAKRDIEQNSSVPLYANAAEAEAAVAAATADNRPASPIPSVAATVTLGANYTVNWTAGGACPVDMTLTYKLYENNVLVASQPTQGFTKNYTNSATQFLDYVVQTDCVRGALVVSSDMSAAATAKVIPAAPSSLVINTQPAATNAALNSNLTSTATCLYGTTPRYNIIQFATSWGAAGTTVANVTSVNRAINSGFTVVEGASYQYKVEAWCISAFDKSVLTNANTNPFSTLINAPATAPAFTAPLQGASNVAINAPVTWNSVVCATGTTTQYNAAKDINGGVATTPTVINAWTTALSLVSNNTQGNTVGYTVAARCHGTAPAGVDSVPTAPGTVSFTTVINVPATAPTFTSPAANAIDIAINAAVTWTTITCPTATTTQYYATKNLNGNIAVSPATVIDNWTTDVSLASANTQGSTVGYTVAARCAGPNANSGSTATNTVKYTTMVAAPVTPLFTAPADNATSVATTAAVTWAAATCATGTVPKYFTTKNIDKNVAIAPQLIDNWTANRTLATNNTEGTTVGYTLAARCEGPNAVSVGSANDTVKFTTLVTAPLSNVISAPANNATDIATNATVTWDSVTCALGVTAKYYVVKNVDAGLAITHIPVVSYTTALSYVSSNTQGNTVGYAVKARCDGPNANSTDSAYTWMRYTTAISAPNVPAVTAPINGSTDVALNATVIWSASTCATGTTAKYFAVKNTDKNVTIPDVTVVNYTTALSYATTNTEGNRVGYAVKARCDGPNANSTDSGWGSTKYTTLVKAPTGVPVFTAPLANATNVATNANVTWSGVTCTTGMTAKYYMTKDINAGVAMSPRTVIDSWTTDLSYVSNNAQGHTVGYTVEARCDGPNDVSTSTATSTLKYTTAISAPTAPLFTTPLEGAMSVATTTAVTWSAAVCAASTTVEYYTTKNMNAGAAITAQVIDNWSSSTGTSLASSNTQGNKVGYTVQARCVGPNATSTSSAIDSLTYTTAILAPTAPLFTSPAEGATNVATNATVSWSVATCAPSTTVKYYTTKNMQNGVAAGPWVIDNWTAGNTLSNANPEGNRLGYTVAARCDGPNDVSASSATDSLTYTTAITAPAMPLFTAPAEGATNVATNATVTWSAAVCGTGTTAKYYTTKNIDKNIAITPVVIDNYTVGNSLVSSNTEGTTVGYTVRARCDGANVVSAASTNDALKYTTIMNAPASPAFTAPLANAMDVSTTSAVTWGAVTCATGGTVQYYTTKNVDGNVTMATPTVIDNWSSTTGTSLSTSNTQGNTVGYTVAARCVGPNATSVASATRSLKYTTAILAPTTAPLFTAPAEGATNIATNAAVTWSAAVCATGTTVQYYTKKNVDKGVTMTTPTVIDNWSSSTGTSLSSSNTQGNTVGYTVQARCVGPNDTSASSAMDSLKYTTMIAAPAKPYYTSPAEAATNVATNATLTWGAVTCAAGTTTEYWTTKNLNGGVAITPSVMDAWNTDLTYVTNNTEGNRVGYTVKAHCDGPNADSADSATDTLTYTTLITTPAEPKFIYPAEAQMDVPTNAAVTWGAGVCATGTTTQYYTTKYNDKDVNLTTPTVIDNWSSSTGTSLSTSNTQGTTVGYTLAARCVGPNVTSGSSTTDYVKYTTIMNAPAKPMFTTPAEGATGIATNAAVNWGAVTCATGGTVQYYTKKNVEKGVTMTTPTVIDNWSSSTGTSLSTSNTQGNTVGYTVEARCVGPNDTSVSSGIDSLKYTTVINAPAKPYYTSPAEGAMDVATNVTLTWGAVTCATGTTTEYYTTKNWNAGVIDTTPSVIDSWNTDLTYVTNNTQGNNVGYTVKAHCDGPNADSADSATDQLKFTTKISNPTVAPLFTSPAEGAVDIATNATVRWSAATCATGTTAKYYTTKYWDKGVADTTPYVMDNWTTSVSYVTGNKQGYQVGYTVKARCDGPNDVSGSTGTDYLKYTTKVTAPAAVSSWNDGGLTVGWGSTSCAAEATTWYRVVDRKINNSTVANYGAWQPEGQWGNTSWVSAWPSVKNGYPQWADVQAKCVGANDESSVTGSANVTKWIRNFGVSFSTSIMPEPGGKWRRMTVDASCPADTSLGDFWFYVAGNGWGATRTPGNLIQTDEGDWIWGATGAGTGGNSGWNEVSKTYYTIYIDTTANWGAGGNQGWGARVTGNDMHATYWNATSWGNYAYWWYGTCTTPYAVVGAKGSHWENQDGTNVIRNMGDPGTRHNAALDRMSLTQAGVDALQ